jgi:glucokinase
MSFMGRIQTITASDMRRINRSAILEIVRRESPISRTLIAEKLDVSLPTVLRIIDDLIEEGLVRSQGETEWSGGRRRSLIEFNAEEQVVIGVDLGGTKIFGAIADLGGNILDEVELSRPSALGEASYDRLVELIENLMASPRLEGHRLRGIGVGAPGVTLHREGIVTWAPSLNWRDYPLRQKLTEKFNMPVIVDNDVNLAALGELWFGAGQNVQNMIMLTNGAGIGSGIIIDGALYRGAHEAAGEIGYLMPGREFLGRKYDGFGALEEVASGTGIADRARQILKGQRSQNELEALTAEDVFEAARHGEEWAQLIIDQAIDYLAIAVASVSAYFDPELIVLAGGVSHSLDLLVEPILNRMNGTTPVALQVVLSVLGHRATVLGAVVNVLHATEDSFIVRRLA